MYQLARPTTRNGTFPVSWFYTTRELASEFVASCPLDYQKILQNGGLCVVNECLMWLFLRDPMWSPPLQVWWTRVVLWTPHQRLSLSEGGCTQVLVLFAVVLSGISVGSDPFCPALGSPSVCGPSVPATGGPEWSGRPPGDSPQDPSPAALPLSRSRGRCGLCAGPGTCSQGPDRAPRASVGPSELERWTLRGRRFGSQWRTATRVLIAPSL